MTLPPASLYIGDTWLWLITAADASGNVLDLVSAYTVAGEFYTPLASTPYDVTVANGRIVLGGAPGQFAVRLEPALTATVRPPSPQSNATTRVQIFVIDASGNRTTIGVLPVLPVQP